MDELSFLMNQKIVLINVMKLFKTESISYEGMATAEDFADYLLRTGKISKEEYDQKQKNAKYLLS